MSRPTTPPGKGHRHDALYPAHSPADNPLRRGFPPLGPNVSSLTSNRSHALLLKTSGHSPSRPPPHATWNSASQELLRHVGLDLTDWSFNHLETGPLPQPPLHHDGQRYRRRDPSPNTDRYPLRPCPPLASPLRRPRARRARLAYSRWSGVLASLPARRHTALAERRALLVAGPNIYSRAALWTPCWPATTTSAGRPGLYVTSARPSPRAWRRTAPRPKSSKILEWLQQASVSHGRLHRPSLVVGRDGIHLPHAYGAELTRKGRRRCR